MRKEPDGSCLPYGQILGDNDRTLRDEFGFEAAQILARVAALDAECLMAILLGTMVLQVLAVGELPRPSVLFSRVASGICALSGARSLVSLVFYRHKWCNESHGGDCTLGAGAYLTIAAGVVYFVAAVLYIQIPQSVESSSNQEPQHSEKNKANDSDKAIEQSNSKNVEEA